MCVCVCGTIGMKAEIELTLFSYSLSLTFSECGLILFVYLLTQIRNYISVQI